MEKRVQQDKHSGADGPVAETVEGPDELVRFGVSMPASLVRELDNWRKSMGYTNRSEAVRDLVRDALVEAHWQAAVRSPDEAMVGVVTLVYSHATRQINDNLTHMQHESHDTAVASLHIHLTHDNCLEVIVLRGCHADVVQMAGRLISARGVLHGKFIPTTSGEDIS